VLFALVIWGLSGAGFASTESSQAILPILRWLFPSASPVILDGLHYTIRKSGHLTEYFFFSLLLFRAFRSGQPGWQLRWAVMAILAALGYSILDEIHQSFVPSRGASGWDCLIDTSGAILAQCATWIALKRQAGASLVRS
jgi:VanZ family protein